MGLPCPERQESKDLEHVSSWQAAQIGEQSPALSPETRVSLCGTQAEQGREMSGDRRRPVAEIPTLRGCSLENESPANKARSGDLPAAFQMGQGHPKWQ